MTIIVSFERYSFDNSHHHDYTLHNIIVTIIVVIITNILDSKQKPSGHLSLSVKESEDRTLFFLSRGQTTLAPPIGQRTFPTEKVALALSKRVVVAGLHFLVARKKSALFCWGSIASYQQCGHICIMKYEEKKLQQLLHEKNLIQKVYMEEIKFRL